MATQKFMGRGQLIERLAAQTGSMKSAISILQKRGQMDATGKLTKTGQARNAMTAQERAIDRASKASGAPKSSFHYDPKTNRATRGTLLSGKRKY